MTCPNPLWLRPRVLQTVARTGLRPCRRELNRGRSSQDYTDQDAFTLYQRVLLDPNPKGMGALAEAVHVALQPAAQHVEGLIHRPDAHVPRVLILHTASLKPVQAKLRLKIQGQ